MLSRYTNRSARCIFCWFSPRNEAIHEAKASLLPLVARHNESRVSPLGDPGERSKLLATEVSIWGAKLSPSRLEFPEITPLMKDKNPACIFRDVANLFNHLRSQNDLTEKWDFSQSGWWKENVSYVPFATRQCSIILNCMQDRVNGTYLGAKKEKQKLIVRYIYCHNEQ